MYRVLIVDDESYIRLAIRRYCELEGWSVVEAVDGDEAIEICQHEDFDVMVLDIMLPTVSGFDAYQKIKEFKNIPTLMLSAKGEEADKLYGFRLGIDDYVVKPFSTKELIARLKVILSRSIGNNSFSSSNKMIFEGLEINIPARRITVDGVPVNMTPKETDLLFFLATNANIVFTRRQLLEKVWGYGYYGDDRTVDAHIKMLRSSIGPYRRFVKTLRGVGYKFEAL